MNWLEMLNQIFEVCVLPLLGILTVYAVNYIKARAKELTAQVENENARKYAEMITETIASCVLATSQTYVDTLKAQGKFDAEAQKIAFQQTYDAIISFLSEEAKEYITEMYGDITKYLTQRIEAEVKLNK